MTIRLIVSFNAPDELNETINRRQQSGFGSNFSRLCNPLHSFIYLKRVRQNIAPPTNGPRIAN
jgi:hypothetical protein